MIKLECNSDNPICSGCFFYQLVGGNLRITKMECLLQISIKNKKECDRKTILGVDIVE